MSFERLLPGIRNKFSRFITEDGTLGGNFNAIDDFSVGNPTLWLFTPQEKEAIQVKDLIISIEDNVGDFQADKYGSLAELTNGIGFGFVRRAQAVNLNHHVTVPINIKSNQDYGSYCSLINMNDRGPGKPSSINYVYDFTGEGIGPLTLSEGDIFFIILHDDFRSLTGHHFHLRGDVYKSK